jgi:NAD+ kinase
MTSLDLFGEYVRKKVADGVLTPSHLEVMQKGHREHQETLASLRDTLGKHGISHTAVSHVRYWPEVDKFDAVIAVGGDGTVLEASHHIDNSRVPIFGLRSSPQSIGHLCAYDRTEIDLVVSDLKRQEFSFVLAHRLRAVIHSIQSNSEIETQSILNDFLFCNTNPAATTRYRVSFGERTEQHMSSGIWISAPAGSSAAIQSAGGSAASLEDPLFQFKVRELYHPPGLELKITGQIFDPDVDHFLIENVSDSAILAPDGHQNSYSLSYGDRILFKRALPLCLVRRG